ncbi:MAG: hypothetical protein PUC63_02680 [Clostridiales bacterium]|nr:hypothetical protein [Clostridiales bacterium]
MLDNESYERLKKLSDSDFRALILRIAEAAGADAQKTAAMIASSSSLKSNLASMSREDAERFIESAGRERSEEIYRIISGR